METAVTLQRVAAKWKEHYQEKRLINIMTSNLMHVLGHKESP